MNIDEYKINDLIEIKNKKDALIKEGNMPELIKLKNAHPAIFIKENEIELESLLSTIDYISQTPHFKRMLKEDKKSRFIVIDFENWKIGMLNEALAQHEVIKYPHIQSISRTLVKEAIMICLEICQIQDLDKIKIASVIPFMGLLIKEILMLFPEDKREGQLKRALYKLKASCSSDKMHSDTMITQQFPIMTALDSDNQIRNSFQELITTLLDKFDKRKDFYADLIFFCLIEVSDFISLLISNILGQECDTENMLNQIENKIVIH